MIYGTYLGGSDFEHGSHIAVDTAGAAYVTGETGFNSSDFPTMNPIQGALRGGGGAFDAFVSKLSPDGTSLIYSTYLGGSGSEGGWGIATDASGAAYVTGSTTSTNFPTTPTSLQPKLGVLCVGNDRNSDAFVVKITDDSLASPPAGASVAGPPTSESSSTSSERKGGGGAMDALFVAVLAQLAVAGALRRRNRRGQ